MMRNLHPFIHQLFAEGYRVGDRVVGRCLEVVPDGVDKSTAVDWWATLTENNLNLTEYRWRSGGIDPNGTNHPDGLAWLRQQNERHGIYYNINAGRTNRDVERFYTIAWEDDKTEFATQQAKIDAFPLAPTTVVRTSRSKHTKYRIVENECDKTQWSSIQEEMSLTMGSDPAIKDLPRLMRCAGFDHVKWKDGSYKFTPCELEVCEPDRIYTVDQIRSAMAQFAPQPFSKQRYRAYNFAIGKLNQRKSGIKYPSIDPELFRTCDESELEEQFVRLRLYARLCEQEHKGTGDGSDPAVAWTMPLQQTRKRYRQEVEVDTVVASPEQIESLEDPNEHLVLRWARLYGLGWKRAGSGGRSAWDTCRCPVHGSSSNSFDNLHINRFDSTYNIGALSCKSGCDSGEIIKAFRQLAKDANDPTWNWSLKKDDNDSKEQQTPAERSETFREHILAVNANVIVHAQAKDSDTIHRQKSPDPRDLFRLGYEPDLVVNQRYLDLETIDTKGSRLIVIKSAMDTGKTTGLVKWIPLDESLLTFSNTILLAQNLSKKFSCAFYKDASADELNQAKRLTITPNSLPRLLTYQKQFDYVVIDEADQIIEALVAGPLCKNERHLIIQKIQYFLLKAKRVILSDADISRPVIDWVAHVMNEKPFVIVNEYQPFAGRVAYEFSTKEAILAYQNRLLEEGNRIAISTDSRATAKGVGASMAGLETIEGYDNIDLESEENAWIREIEANHPDRQIRCVHGDNSNEADTKAFVQNINEHLRTNPLDVFCFNSALQSGTSIDERPEGERQTFDAVTGIFSGNTLPFTHIAQLPHRVRAKVPFAFHFNEKLRKGLETNPLTIAERLLRHNRESSFALNVDIETGMLEPSDPALLQLRSELEARRNFALMNNRELFIEYLTDMGYDIQQHADDVEAPTETTHTDELKLCRKVVSEAENASTIIAADITDETAKELRNVPDPDFETRCVLAKHDLKTFYGQEVTKDLIALDKGGELRQNLQLLELVMNNEALAQRKDLSERKRYRSIADLHHHTLLRNILIDCGVLDVLDPDVEYSEANLVPFAEAVKSKAAELKAFGIGIRVASRQLKEMRHHAKKVTTLLKTNLLGWFHRWLLSSIATSTTPPQYIENEAISGRGGTRSNSSTGTDSSLREPTKPDEAELYRSLHPICQLIGLATMVEKVFRKAEASASEVHGIVLNRLGLKREEVGRVGRKRIYRIKPESWEFAMSVLKHRQQQREERNRQRELEVEAEARRFDAMTPTDMLAAIEKEIATEATMKPPALAFLAEEPTRTTPPDNIETEAFEASGGTDSNRSTDNDSSVREPVKVGSAVLFGSVGLEYAKRYGWVVPNDALEVSDIIGAKYQRNENEKGTHVYLKVRSKGGFSRTLPAEWFVSNDKRPVRFDPFGEVGQIPYRSLSLWENWLLGSTCADDIVRFERLRSVADIQAFRAFLSQPDRNDTLQIMTARFDNWGIARDWLPEPKYPSVSSDPIRIAAHKAVPLAADVWELPDPDPWRLEAQPVEPVAAIRQLSLEIALPSIAISSQESTLAPESKLIDSVKKMGKQIARYVGEFRVAGTLCLAPGTLVEYAMDRFGIMAEVKAIGEAWAEAIAVNPKSLAAV